MRKRRGFGMGVYAGAALLAAGASIGLWRAGALADQNLSSAINVDIFDPESLDVLVYSPDGDIPDYLPIGVLTDVSPETVRGGATVDDVTSVVSTLGGDLDTATGAITGELDKSTGSLFFRAGDERLYLAVLDLGEMDFSGSRGGTKVSSDVIRSVAIASNYYSTRSVSNIVESDSVNVTTTVADADSIDNDGNCFPNASALLDREFILINRSGVITLIAPLDGTGRGANNSIEVTHTYETSDGPVQVTIEAPTLEALQLADSDFDAYDTARLMVSISDDARTLVDTPTTADPEAEFDLVDGSNPLPTPKNIFVRVAIAVTTTAARGSVQAWDFVDDLPGGLEYVATLSGPAIADKLKQGTDVDAYTYGLTLHQSNENIDATAGNDAQTDSWAEADGGIEINNEQTEDDAADSRAVVNAEDGDDTIRATFSIGSAIFGSNVTPKASSSGSNNDGGNCFVATAAFGTPMAKQIGALRSVRDQYLVKSAIGAAFVDAYYHVSPPFAGMIAQSDIARMIARGVLTPVVVASRLFVGAPMATLAMVIAMAVFAVGLLRRICRPYGTRALVVRKSHR